MSHHAESVQTFLGSVNESPLQEVESERIGSRTEELDERVRSDGGELVVLVLLICGEERERDQRRGDVRERAAPLLSFPLTKRQTYLGVHSVDLIL